MNPNRPTPPFPRPPLMKQPSLQITITVHPPSGSTPGQIQVSANTPGITPLQLIELFSTLITSNAQQLGKQQSMIIDPNKKTPAPVAVPPVESGNNDGNQAS